MTRVPADLEGSQPRLEWTLEGSEGEAFWEKDVGQVLAGISNVVQQ